MSGLATGSLPSLPKPATSWIPTSGVSSGTLSASQVLFFFFSFGCDQRLTLGLQNAEGVDYLTRTPEGQEEESIQTYLDKNQYSQSFRNNYLLPMTASIWSTPPDTAALDFPILTLLQFLHNHHLLQLTGKPSWLTLKNGSRSYVEKILENVPPEQLHLATPVMSVDTFSVKKKSGVNLHLADRVEQFDHVIFACHADTALRLLGSHASEEEQEILSAFEFSKNTATLHRDTNVRSSHRWTFSSQS